MNPFILGVAISLLVLMGLVFLRIIMGPSAIDRLVAVNIIGTKATVILVLFGLLFEYDILIWGCNNISFAYVSLIQIIFLLLCWKIKSAYKKENFYSHHYNIQP